MVFLIHTELRCTVNHTSDLQKVNYEYKIFCHRLYSFRSCGVLLHFGRPITPKLPPIACVMHTNSTSFILALRDVTLRHCITGSRWFEITYRFYLQDHSGLCFMIHEPFTTSATPHTGKNGNPQSHRCANFKAA